MTNQYKANRRIANLPNIISAVRIVGSFALFLTTPLSGAFIAIYALCGLSDMLDGYIARRFGCVSETGAVLDSVSDAIFIAVLAIIFIPIIHWQPWMLIWMAVIVLIRCASLVIGFKKFQALAFLHTYANKITGLVLFGFPFLLILGGLSMTVITLCVIATVSATEELAINLRSKKLDRNRRSLFHQGV